MRRYTCRSCTRQLESFPRRQQQTRLQSTILVSSQAATSRHDASAGRAVAGARKLGARAYTTQTPTTTANRPPFKCAIIGSGPAGFYSAHRIQQRMPDAQIDMYEALPTPYGLVRFGVAPDHPEVKNCIDKFTEIASSPNFNFIGNTPVGNASHQLPLSILAENYNALLFSYGASEDRTLGLPNESLSGVLSARAFVGWYNGLPEYAHLSPALDSSEEAVVIGQGNVALDVARILLSPLDKLRQTDITEQALQTLFKSRVKRVRVVGRRGPLQASFTIKEIRELMQLPSVAFSGIDESLFLTPNLKKLPRQLMRVAQVLQKGSVTQPSSAEKEWALHFMLSPTSFLPSTTDASKLGAVQFQEQEFTTDTSAVDLGDMYGIRGLRVQSTAPPKQVTLETGLAFRSVGYKSTAISGMQDLGIPFDAKMGIIPNDLYGRVLSSALGPGALAAGHVNGVYCAGWVKRGPTGVIASTMEDAFTTAEIVAKDWNDGVKFLGAEGGQGEEWRRGWDGVKGELEQRGMRRVSWEEWEIIDKEEKRRGGEKGKEREKCRSVEEMLKILDG